MGRILYLTAAIAVLTASWVCAGTFEVLAGATAVRPPTPLYVQSGSAVKAGFKPSLKATSDIGLESDAPYADVTPVAAPKVEARPAVAFRERPSGAMAPPPPSRSGVDADRGSVAQMRDDSSLESDLEKELVLPPPPPKTEEKVESRPVVEEIAPAKKPSVSETKAEKKKAKTRVRRNGPSDYPLHATSGKPIRKVRPISGNQWHYPAAAYGPPPSLSDRHSARQSDRGYVRNVPQGGEYMNSAPGRPIAQPPSADRFVRDGVTIKLAPASAGAGYPDYVTREDDTASDILAAAAEVIGLPFAFISSLF